MKSMSLRSSYWIVDSENNIIFGKGRMEILRCIDRTGSINQTAKRLKMSYKTVWSKLKSTEKHLGQKIVVADRKTGTHLTPTGRRLVAAFSELEKRCMSADDRIFADIFHAGGTS